MKAAGDGLLQLRTITVLNTSNPLLADIPNHFDDICLLSKTLNNILIFHFPRIVQTSLRNRLLKKCRPVKFVPTQRIKMEDEAGIPISAVS